MEIQSTHIRVPSSSKLYLFGSVLTSASPNDLDVLVVYDPIASPPEFAYKEHRDTVTDLEKCYGLPVHLTLLTRSEEGGTSFISRVGAIEFDQKPRLTSRRSELLPTPPYS